MSEIPDFWICPITFESVDHETTLEKCYQYPDGTNSFKTWIPVKRIVSEPTHLLTVCAWCKRHKVNGYWIKDAVFHPSVQVTHGICPDCRDEYFPKSHIQEVLCA